MNHTTPDPRHWATTDGHRYTSIPTTVPAEWRRIRNDEGHLTYLAGAYTIVRRPYGRASWSYTVYRDGIELRLSLTAMLHAAKERAVENAEGRDVVNVA